MEKLNFHQRAFVMALIEKYGYTVQATLKEIAQGIGNISYTSVRNYLLFLEAAKILKIENKGKYHQTYYLNDALIQKTQNG